MDKINLDYTDLAMEAAESLDPGGVGIPGVGMDISETDIDGGVVIVTTVTIEDERGAEALGKPKGVYVTLECEAMKTADARAHKDITCAFAEEMKRLPVIADAKSVLIVGLGNRYVTPDALGPRVASAVLVTRHLEGLTKEELGTDEYTSVSAIAPGVLGTTGIETGEIVKGLVEHVKPDVVIAIDALAARNARRVNSTIQFSDTGLSPGSGMGVGRTALSMETLGVPVVACGVPTVVDAATLVNDTMNLMLSDMKNECVEGSAFYEMLESLSEGERYGMIKRLLDPYVGAMFVTPKDVDSVIDRLSHIISDALNLALQPSLAKADIGIKF